MSDSGPPVREALTPPTAPDGWQYGVRYQGKPWACGEGEDGRVRARIRSRYGGFEGFIFIDPDSAVVEIHEVGRQGLIDGPKTYLALPHALTKYIQKNYPDLFKVIIAHKVDKKEVPSRPRARTTDPSTSHAAAFSVRNVNTTHQAILELFKAAGKKGLADMEMVAMYETYRLAKGWPLVSESGLRSRRNELVKVGCIEDTGRKTRLATKRMGKIWAITEEGIEECGDVH